MRLLIFATLVITTFSYGVHKSGVNSLDYNETYHVILRRLKARGSFHQNEPGASDDDSAGSDASVELIKHSMPGMTIKVNRTQERAAELLALAKIYTKTGTSNTGGHTKGGCCCCQNTVDINAEDFVPEWFGREGGSFVTETNNTKRYCIVGMIVMSAVCILLTLVSSLFRDHRPVKIPT